MIQKIINEITCLSLPFPSNYPVNCYFIEGKEGYTVVDTGVINEEAEKIFTDYINNLTKPVNKIIFTHIHPDHIGFTRLLIEKFDSEVWVFDKGVKVLKVRQDQFEKGRDSSLETEYLLKVGLSLNSDEMYEQDFKDYYRFQPTNIFEAGEMILLGDAFYEVIYTPGHCNDHVCFFNPVTGVLFAGDYIANRFYPIIILDEFEKNPIGNFYNHIHKLENKQIMIACPGHGEIITKFSGKLTELKVYHLEQAHKYLNQMDNKRYSVIEIIHQFFTIDLEGKYDFLLLRTVTYLYFLESLGEISIEEEEGIYYFKRN